MSILKLTSTQIEELLKLKNVHKSVAFICEYTNYSLTLANDVLRALPNIRNSKFKSKLADKLPIELLTYLNIVWKDHSTVVDLQIRTNKNSPLWLPYVISESKHFTSCLSLGVRGALLDDVSVYCKLKWVTSDSDVVHFYKALLHTSVYCKLKWVTSDSNDVTVPGFGTTDWVSFRSKVQSNAGCNRCYLFDEYIAFTDGDVHYVTLGEPFDIRNPDCDGYTGRARLLRHGQYWALETIYGNLGVSKTRVMNYLTELGYKLIESTEKPVEPAHYESISNRRIYENEEIYRRYSQLYEPKPVDYLVRRVGDKLKFLHTSVTLNNYEPRKPIPDYVMSCTLKNNENTTCHIVYANRLNRILPGAITVDVNNRTYRVNSYLGDYKILSFNTGLVLLEKYVGTKRRKIRIDLYAGTVSWHCTRHDAKMYSRYVPYSGVSAERVRYKVIHQIIEAI